MPGFVPICSFTTQQSCRRMGTGNRQTATPPAWHANMHSESDPDNPMLNAAFSQLVKAPGEPGSASVQKQQVATSDQAASKKQEAGRHVIGSGEQSLMWNGWEGLLWNGHPEPAFFSCGSQYRWSLRLDAWSADLLSRAHYSSSSAGEKGYAWHTISRAEHHVFCPAIGIHPMLTRYAPSSPTE